ncbi:MAG: endolytic transglycosylase MltG [Actinobacteria bacterium]|nr:endolytic transglycosylase MltG [Actinomycetota bacterium]MCA1719922.1 endolytic transglycosylase MltG [Actinomycetota bacterium]
MTDLLDLPPAEGRASRRRKKTPRFIGLAVVLVLLLVLVGGAALAVGKVKSHFRSAPDYSGSGTGRAVVQVQPGDSAYNLAGKLAEMGIVKSAAAFRKVAAGNDKAAGLQPGYYQLREHMSAAAALDLLLDPAARLRGRATVPEGSTVQQALAILAKSTEVPLADLKAAAANPAALGLPSYANGKLEGFLFPATYDIEPGSTAAEVLTMMVDRFKEAAQTSGLLEKSKALGISPYDAVVVASLIERESRVDEEYPKVARVVYNRIEQGIPLGIDASILYGLGRTSGALRKSELARDTPYNTRLNRGLPPTPIANPGEAALGGALAPATGDVLYYVLADKTGHHLFTADYNEFLRQKAKSQAEGVF